MRSLFLVFLILYALQCYSQTTKKVIISGNVLSNDSVPIPNVDIINIWTGNMVQTDTNGFFKIEIYSGDSLLVYHISYKNLFISKNTQDGYIILQPENHELLQVNIHNKTAQELRNFQQTMDDIKRIVPLKKLTGFELKSIQNYFAEQTGSHDKGFSPFFGPTLNVPIEKKEKIGITKYLNIKNK